MSGSDCPVSKIIPGEPKQGESETGQGQGWAKGQDNKKEVQGKKVHISVRLTPDLSEEGLVEAGQESGGDRPP